MTRPTPSPFSKGLTLIELTLVISLLLVLTSISIFSANAYSEWQKGRKASEALREVYIAQRLYLADNPHFQVENFTHEILLPYLADSPDSFPTVVDMNDNTLTISVDVTPPILLDASGAVYDESGSSSDSLWDVGDY